MLGSAEISRYRTVLVSLRINLTYALCSVDPNAYWAAERRDPIPPALAVLVVNDYHFVRGRSKAVRLLQWEVFPPIESFERVEGLSNIPYMPLEPHSRSSVI